MKHSVKSVVRVCCIVVAALSFSGCSALTDRWTITTVDDTASGLAPVHYEASIKSYLETRLKDPFSAHYRHLSAPEKHIENVQVVTQSPTLVNVNGRMRVTRKHCWRVTVEVNAKNSYGAYSGWTTYTFLFRGEDIMSAYP